MDLTGEEGSGDGSAGTVAPRSSDFLVMSEIFVPPGRPDAKKHIHNMGSADIASLFEDKMLTSELVDFCIAALRDDLPVSAMECLSSLTYNIMVLDQSNSDYHGSRFF